MKTKLLVTLSAGALLIGGVGIASAGSNAAADAKAAAGDAAKAARALIHHQAPVAVDAAEAAVAREGRNADYRLLLGQSYVAAGRFVSARTAFADAVALAPGNGKAALNLTLMQIATGDWAGARCTLDEHSAGISVADRGLATALAGDPAGAVAMLTPLVRSPEATPKARQNLALSLALAGQWQASRLVAAVDVSPADLDARMEQWAAFARPHDAGAQVASLLGVTQAADTGLPVTLALGGGTPPMAMAATIAPAPVSVATTAPAAVLPAAAPGFVATRVTFLPRREVVQPLPAGATKIAGRGTMIAAERLPAKVALGRPAPQGARGDFFVQLGAFPSSAVAKDAWGRAVHRLPALAARGASGMAFSTRGITFYRLSVGGFARGDADALCRRYRTTGGACFVRAGAGDQIASWSRRGVEVASR